ncbi:MAG: DUF1080 domain-containing protein [Verrucomicrobiota bacterium]
MSKLLKLSPLALCLLALTLISLPACKPGDTPPKPEADKAKDQTAPATAPAKAAAEKPKEKPKAAAKPAAPKKDPNIISLFDGKKMGQWKPVEFGGEGEVFITEKGDLQFDFGAMMTGVVWGDKPPATSNYELSLEVMKLSGNDFFLGLTFPVKDSHCSFIAGGWGGGIIGISSIDDLDASENETMNIEGFEDNRWYKIKVRVTDPKIEVWLDDKQFVDLDLKDKKISVRPGDIELCIPLGLCSFQTRAQYRNIVWTNIKAQSVN